MDEKIARSRAKIRRICGCIFVDMYFERLGIEMNVFECLVDRNSFVVVVIFRKYMQFVSFVFHRKMWNSRRIKDGLNICEDKLENTK